MHEFDLIKNYFSKLTKNNKSALNLNDDVFFDKKKLKDLTRSLLEVQKKCNIKLCGGDTTFSKKLSFSITVIGFSKKIIFRNNTKINDDIYVTGNLGDSFVR